MPSVAPTVKPKSRLSWLIATFFGVGFLPPGPGTWASAVTVALWWAASHLLQPGWLVPAAVLVSLAITIIGISPSTVVARESGRSEEHTSGLQSPCNLLCRLLLEKKKD